MAPQAPRIEGSVPVARESMVGGEAGSSFQVTFELVRWDLGFCPECLAPVAKGRRV